MSNETPETDSDQIARDSRALRSSMENALDRAIDDQSAEAFRQEVRQITDRGPEHTRQVYDRVANEVGGRNLFSNNALITRNGTLCLSFGNVRSLFTGDRDVCAYNDGSTAVGKGSRVWFRAPENR